jgi:hypothetical protein
VGKIQFDFYEAEVQRHLREFRSLVGWRDLSRIIYKVADELHHRKIFSQALLDRYAVSLGLQEIYDYLKATGRVPMPRKSTNIYAACTFAASAVALSKQLSWKARDRLIGMVRDNLSLDGDSRRLQHELTVAAHFSQHGWDMTFIDLEGVGNFDYLVRKGGVEADVECKTVSGDTGNVIHQGDALRFMENVHTLLISGTPDAWWSVNITFPQHLPKIRQEHLALADIVAKCMREGRALEHVDGVVVEVSRQDMPTLANDNLHAFVQAAARQLQHRQNGHVGSIYNKKHLLSLCVSSTRPTRMVSNTYESIKRGCKQLSRERAGFVWTQFVDMSDRDLVRLADETRNAFDYISTRIFKNKDRRHVAVLSYSADGEVKLTERRSPHTISRYYSRGGDLRTHYSLQSAFPLTAESGFP